MKKDLNQLALTAAGILNIFGTLLFSKFFTNTEITNADPFAMQPFSLFMLMVWGLAMISVAKSYTKTPYLIAVFAIEKSIYAIIWCHAMSRFSCYFYFYFT